MIPLKALIKPGWLHVPVRPAVRIAKQNNGYSYSYYNYPKFENKDGIPRLFWFRRDEPLFNVFEHVVKQYSFTFSEEHHNPDEYFSLKYKPLLNYISKSENNDPEDEAPAEDFKLNQDETVLPMVVNIMNPHYEANKYSSLQPRCPACDEKPCKNCPLPALPNYTLNDLLGRVAVEDAKFNDNFNLFLNKADLARLQDQIEESGDEEMKSASPYKTGLQDSSDEDMMPIKPAKKSGSNKFATLSLELVFVNRVIKSNSNTIMQKLLGFEEFRKKKPLYSKQ